MELLRCCLQRQRWCGSQTRVRLCRHRMHVDVYVGEKEARGGWGAGQRQHLPPCSCVCLFDCMCVVCLCVLSAYCVVCIVGGRSL